MEGGVHALSAADASAYMQATDRGLTAGSVCANAGRPDGMGYVIAAVLVLAIVAAGVSFFVLNAAKRQRRSATADASHGDGTPGSEAAIVAPDEQSPLGDTDQHSDAPGREGAGKAEPGGSVPPAGEGGVGGEGESGGPVRPDSERLANPPR
jgi:hypothetical protein